MPHKPQHKPSHPYFSSGPCAKIPDWSPTHLHQALRSRSHRSSEGLERLSLLIKNTKEILEIPPEYHVGILPGSATGAIESAMWNLLGANPLTILSHDVFSQRWEQDITTQLNLKNVDIRQVTHGTLPPYDHIPEGNDILLNWNGSTSGVKFPHLDFADPQRSGLVIADITSAAFTTEIPWTHLDATAFSWQKGLGGEAAHGVLVLSPKAVDRLNTYQPPWPLPYLFKLRSQGQFYKELFQEKLLNTPSLLCVEDFSQALKWAKEQGGLQALVKRSQMNFDIIDKWVTSTPWVDFLATDPATRSTSTIVLALTAPRITALEETSHRHFIGNLTQLLADQGIAYDINNHGGAPPSLRIWGGPTLEATDIQALLPWIEWAYETVLQKIP